MDLDCLCMEWEYLQYGAIFIIALFAFIYTGQAIIDAFRRKE